MVNREAGNRAPSGPEMDTLVAVYLDGLRQLAAGGHVEEACRLAGRACAALRRSDLANWKKFNAFLHRTAATPPRS